MIRKLPIRAALCVVLNVPAAVIQIGTARAETEAGIVALVNDEPISSHDIEMRVKLALANSQDIREQLQQKLKEPRVQALWEELVRRERPTSKEEAQKLQVQLVKQLQGEIVAAKKKTMKKEVLSELIEERLQLQQATKLGVMLSDEELDEQLERIAGRNKNPQTGQPMGRDEFSKALEKSGIPIAEFRNRMKAKGSWLRVVRQKFQFQVNIGDQDVDRMISAEDDANAKVQTIYSLERLSLPVSLSASEKKKAETFARAEALRQSVSTCAQLHEASKQLDGAELKPLGSRTGDSFPQNMRVYLSRMADGELSPPTLTSSGVELYAICGRKQKKVADLSKRDEVKEKLRAQEFEILARRYLQDLRQEASIEYR